MSSASLKILIGASLSLMMMRKRKKRKRRKKKTRTSRLSDFPAGDVVIIELVRANRGMLI